jgi:hypothetical protein
MDDEKQFGVLLTVDEVALAFKLSPADDSDDASQAASCKRCASVTPGACNSRLVTRARTSARARSLGA